MAETPAIRQSVVASLDTADDDEAKDWKVVLSAVAVEEEEVVPVHDVGLHKLISFPLSEVDAPNSS